MTNPGNQQCAGCIGALSFPIATSYKLKLGHWVTRSVGHLGHLSRPGHRVIILTRSETQFIRFSKKCPKYKAYICNAEMTEVIVICLLLD